MNVMITPIPEIAAAGTYVMAPLPPNWTAPPRESKHGHGEPKQFPVASRTTKHAPRMGGLPIARRHLRIIRLKRTIWLHLSTFPDG